MGQKTNQIHLRLPATLYKAVREQAEREGMSINAWLLAVIAASHPAGWPDKERDASR